jgi:hypothetical protein
VGLAQERVQPLWTDGWCWPGTSHYLDFTPLKVRDWWTEQIEYVTCIGSTPNLYTWNNMNKPSLFNGLDFSMHKNCNASPSAAWSIVSGKPPTVRARRITRTRRHIRHTSQWTPGLWIPASTDTSPAPARTGGQWIIKDGGSAYFCPALIFNSFSPSDTKVLFRLLHSRSAADWTGGQHRAGVALGSGVGVRFS